MTSEDKIHPDMRELISAKEVLARTTDPEILRQEWINYGKKLSRPYPPGMKVEDVSFACPGVGNEGMIKVRIYKPAGLEANPPCVVFLHGGAFIKGNLDSGDSNAWGMADYAGAIVISVEYRLAPEFGYPAALHDAYGVLKYIDQHADDLGVDRSRIAVWGESAGGNLAAALALVARDRGGPDLVAQVLIYPCLTNDFNAESYRVHADSPGLTTAACVESWAAYLGGREITSHDYATPLKFDDLSNVAPAFIHYAEIDPLADDGPRYANRLREAAVPTTLRCATGMIHGFLRARFTGTTAEREFMLPCMYLRGIFARRCAG